jgi:hypothetical protein
MWYDTNVSEVHAASIFRMKSVNCSLPIEVPDMSFEAFTAVMYEAEVAST